MIVAATGLVSSTLHFHGDGWVTALDLLLYKASVKTLLLRHIFVVIASILGHVAASTAAQKPD